MWANGFLILFLIGMTYWWGLQGLFSAFLHLVVVILAGTLAFAFWEPAAYWMLGFEGSLAPPHAWGVMLMGLYAFFLVILRVISDKLVPGNLQFSMLTNYIAGGACGLFAGMLSAGIVFIGFGFMPTVSPFIGYEPLAVDGTGKVVDSSRPLVVSVDKFAGNFFSGLSAGAFSPWSSRHESLAFYKPDVAHQAALFGQRPDPNSQVIAVPGSVKVEQAVAYNTPVPDLSPAIVQALGDPVKNNENQLVVIDTTWFKKRNTTDMHGTLRLPPTQIRLVTWKTVNARPTEAALHAPLAIVSIDPVTNRREFKSIDSSDASVYSTSDQETFGWVFVIPSDVQPQFLLARHLRIPIDEVKKEAFELRTAVGQTTVIEAPVQTGGTETAVGDTLFVITNMLPTELSKNQVPSLQIDEDNLIVSGKEDTKVTLGRISPANLITAIRFPGHLAPVRVDLSPQKAMNFFDRVLANARLGPIMIEDQNMAPHYAIGYVWVRKRDGNVRVWLDPQNPIQHGQDLPFNQLGEGDELYLYFAIPKPNRITAITLGGARKFVNVEVPQ